MTGVDVMLLVEVMSPYTNSSRVKQDHYRFVFSF